MRKIFQTLSTLAATAILCGGIAYAIEGAEPGAGDASAFKILSSTPADGTETEGIAPGDVISITTNLAAQYPEMTVIYEIQEVKPGSDPEVLKTLSYMNRQEDGSYEAKIYGYQTYDMYAGHNYQIAVTAWEDGAAAQGLNRDYSLGTAYINLVGTASDFAYSDYTLVSITPDPETVTILPADTDKLTVTFDGPVNVDKSFINLGMGMTQSFADIVAVDPTTVNGTEYAKEWNLVFPAGFVATCTSKVYVSVFATDAEGRPVKGTSGEKENSCFSYSWETEAMYGKPAISFAQEPVVKLSEFYCSFNIGLQFSYLMPVKSLEIRKDGLAVAYATEVTSLYTDPENMDEVSTRSKVILDKAITEEGDYQIYIPTDYFTFGTQFNTLRQGETLYDVHIGDGHTAVVTPAEGTVESFDTFTVEYDCNIALNEEGTRPTMMMEGDTTPIGFRQVTAEGNKLTLTLNATITDAGAYQLIIPGDYVLDAATNEAIAPRTFDYTIEAAVVPELPAQFVPAPGKVDQLPATLKATFTNYYSAGLATGKATLTINGGEPITLSDPGFDWDDDANVVEIYLPQAYTADGVYVLNFPEGLWELNDGAAQSPAMEITYTIGDAQPEPTGFTILTSTPANNSELAGFFAGDIIKITTNYAEKYPELYIEYQVDRVSGDERETIKSYSWMNRQEDGSYEAEVFGNFELYQGETYEIVLTAWEDETASHYDESIGTAVITVKGTTEAYVNSEYKLVSVDPAAESILPADTEFVTANYDGMVTMLPVTSINEGSGFSCSFKEFVPVGESEEKDGKTYAKSWKLVFPDGYIAAMTAPINVAIGAADELGRSVQGNMGAGENTWDEFRWETEGMFGTPEFSFGGEPVVKVSEIIVSFTKGIMPSWYMSLDSFKVLKDGDVVAYATDVKSIYTDPENLDETSKACRVILNTTLTEQGDYQVYVPRDYFSFGTQFDKLTQAETTYDFHIGDGYDVTVDPAEGVVESLSAFTVDYGTAIKANEEATLPYILVEGEDYKMGFRDVTVDGNKLVLTLNATTNEPGAYQLVIPADYVLDAATGEAITARTFDYTIETPEVPAEIAEFDPAPGNVTEIPASIKVTFPDYDEVGISSGFMTLTIDGNEPIKLNDAEYDDIDWNVIHINLPQSYTEDGTYVITIPEGYLCDGYGDPLPEVVATYTIGENVGVDLTIEAKHYVVFNINGIKVLDTDDADALKTLAPGLYIINGLKVAVK